MSLIQVQSQTFTKRQVFILASPVFVVALGILAARLFAAWLGVWAWVGVALVYWGSLAVIMGLSGGLAQAIRRWTAKSQGSRWWLGLALVLGLVSFPLLFIPNMQLLASPLLAFLWLIFGMVNACLEEAYWRGFFLDETKNLPRIFTILYSTILFSAIHPLMWGTFSKAQAFDPAHPMQFLPFGIILVILTLAYVLIYLKTKSLRLSVLSHFLSDLGNMSIFVFMNLIKMP